jgi:hypothetical protein
MGRKNATQSGVQENRAGHHMAIGAACCFDYSGDRASLASATERDDFAGTRDTIRDHYSTYVRRIIGGDLT